MPNPKHLPALIKLLDDDSPVVKENVLKELASFGHTLYRELERLNISLSGDQQQRMNLLLEEHSRVWLLSAWKEWTATEDTKEKLESALSLISKFQYGQDYPFPLGMLLDRLANEFRQGTSNIDVLQLSYFLFQTKQIKGVESDYYNPLNSNLIYVIEEKRGIPISLACTYILVGDRLGLDIGGINFPGHFLARATSGKHKYIVDCYNGGRFLDESSVANLHHGPLIPLAELLKLECNVPTIVARVLRNLMNAYQQEGSIPNVQLMTELLEMTQQGESERDEGSEN